MRSNSLHLRFPFLDYLVGSHSIWNRQRHLELSDRYNALLEAKKDILPLSPCYLNSQLHDSKVHSIEDKGRDLTIWLDDIRASDFIYSLCNALVPRVPYREEVFPLGIAFQGVENLSISRINRNDKILGVSKSKYLPMLRYFLYDEALVIEPTKVRIGLVFVTARSYLCSKSQLLLEVTCKSMGFVEKQTECFRRSFPESCCPLFDAFMDARHGGETFEDGKDVEFIEKHRGSGLAL